MTELLNRLKQRKLIQWAVAYLAGAWVSLQVTGLLSDTYGWSPAIMKLMPVALAIGLLIVLVLAWFHGEQGQQRASRSELVILGLITVAGAGMLWAMTRAGVVTKQTTATTTSDQAGAVRLAVLPFENLGRPEDAYIADGISDEIRGKLSTLGRLEVVGRVSSTSYRETKKTQQDIADELDVQYLLVGTVRSQPAAAGQPASIRVSPELLHIAGRNAVPVTRWQEPFDAQLTNIFQVQSDIAERVAAGMDIALSATDRAVFEERPTGNTAAYELYLKAIVAAGEAYSSAGPYREATRIVQEALRLDPEFSRAWADLADWAGLAQWFTARGDTTGEYFRISRGAAERAMQLSPKRDGPVALGNFLLMAKYDLNAGAEAVEKALRVSPDDDRLLTRMCMAEEFRARWSSAAAYCERAVRIDPRNIEALGRAAVSFGAMRDTTRAVAYVTRLRETALASGQPGLITQATIMDLRMRMNAGKLDAVRQILKNEGTDEVLLLSFSRAGWYYDAEQLRRAIAVHVGDSTRRLSREELPVVAYYLLGDTLSARRAAPVTLQRIQQRASALEGAVEVHQGISRMSRALVQALTGNLGEAVRNGERTIQASPLDGDGINAPITHCNMAWIYLLAGDTTSALDVLTPLLVNNHLVTPAEMRIDPRFKALHGNPRFDRLVGR